MRWTETETGVPGALLHARARRLDMQVAASRAAQALAAVGCMR